MPPRTRKTSDNTDDNENVGVPSPIVEDTKEVTGAGTWYENFDQEDFPPPVSVGEGEILLFKVLDSNLVPLEQQSGDVVDTEVNQIVVLEGTTATEKVQDDDGDWVSSGDPISVGTVRSFWINTQILRNAWDEWDVNIDDEGVVKYAGKVTSKRGKREYQKWFVRFNKNKPRRATTATR